MRVWFGFAGLVADFLFQLLGNRQDRILVDGMQFFQAAKKHHAVTHGVDTTRHTTGKFIDKFEDTVLKFRIFFPANELQAVLWEEMLDSQNIF